MAVLEAKVSEIVTGTELKKLREDFLLVRKMVDVPVNVDQVDRATVVGILMGAENRLHVLYHQLLGESISSGEALLGIPMNLATGSCTVPATRPAAPKQKDIIDYRTKAPKLPPEAKAETKKPEEKPAAKKEAKAAKPIQPELDLSGKDSEEKKPAKEKPVPSRMQGLRRLSEVLVSFGNVPHPNYEEARKWCDQWGVKFYFGKYYLREDEVKKLREDFKL